MTYSDSGLIYYADSSNLDTLKGKLIAIYRHELLIIQIFHLKKDVIYMNFI